MTAISREFAGLWHKRFILGEWVAAEGAVYEMLEASAGGRHVESELPALDFHTLGIDYGTTNPFCALIVAVGADERLHVCREWRYDHRAHDRKLTDADYSRRLMAWLRDGADGLTRWRRAAPRRRARSERRQLPRRSCAPTAGAGRAAPTTPCSTASARSPACWPPAGSSSTSPARP